MFSEALFIHNFQGVMGCIPAVVYQKVNDFLKCKNQI